MSNVYGFTVNKMYSVSQLFKRIESLEKALCNAANGLEARSDVAARRMWAREARRVLDEKL